MGFVLIVSIAVVLIVFMLLMSTSELSPIDYLVGGATGILITFATCFSYHLDSKNELEFVLNSKNKEIVFENGDKLKIYYYEVSKSDSTKVKIKAGKEKSPNRKKENEFTNFN
jgi:hypothetical protein